MNKYIHIVKVGGAVINQKDRFEIFLDSFCSLEGPKILVHGGGRTLNDMAQKLGLEVKMVNGRRVTTKQDLDLAKMIYRGKLNVEIVSALAARKLLPIGLSGPDANIIEAIKRPVREIDYGLVGDITKINTSLIREMLHKWTLTPVICALAHDTNGQVLNVNADTIACTLASSLSKDYSLSQNNTYKVRLILSFEKDGVLSNPENEASVISKLNRKMYEKLRESNTLSNGILPKLFNAFNALENGVNQVIICNLEKYIDTKKGTIISL